MLEYFKKMSSTQLDHVKLTKLGLKKKKNQLPTQNI